MSNAHRLDRQRTHLVTGAWHHRVKSKLAQLEPSLCETFLDKIHGVRRRPHRHIDPSKQIRQRADVILVPVGDHDPCNARAPRLQIGEVGMVDVDSKIGLRKRHPAVDHHDRIAGLDCKAVHANFAEPAERDDSERGSGKRGHGMPLQEARRKLIATRAVGACNVAGLRRVLRLRPGSVRGQWFPHIRSAKGFPCARRARRAVAVRRPCPGCGRATGRPERKPFGGALERSTLRTQI